MKFQKGLNLIYAKFCYCSIALDTANKLFSLALHVCIKAFLMYANFAKKETEEGKLNFYLNTNNSNQILTTKLHQNTRPSQV